MSCGMVLTDGMTTNRPPRKTGTAYDHSKCFMQSDGGDYCATCGDPRDNSPAAVKAELRARGLI